MSADNSILSHVFTQNMLRNLIDDHNDIHLFEKIVRRYEISFSNDENIKNENVISEIYQYLGKSYRNEYFYKNTLLNKLIINVHRVNRCQMLNQKLILL